MKRFIRIAAFLLAICALFGMTSCDIIVGELENIVEMFEEKEFGYVFDDLFDKDEIVVACNNIELTDKMMSFFMNDYIMNWYMENSAYAAYFSVDLTQDLRNQKFGQTGYYETSFLGSFDGTWYDYFMTQVKSEVETFVIYANAADKEGIGLDDEDREEIDEVIDSIDKTLNTYGVTYSEWFGKGVTKRDVRRCYELKYKAANFAEFFQDKLENEISYDEIVNYREENKELYYTADCLTYTISESSKGMTADEFKAAKADAKAAADAIAKATSPEQFVEFVESHKASLNVEQDNAEIKTEAEDSYEMYKMVIEYEADRTTNAENKLNDFIFGNESSGKVDAADANDAIVIEETDTVIEKETATTGETKVYDSYSVTVYFVFNAAHVDNDLTHSFSYLVTDNKEVLAKFIEKFNANETKDIDAFVDVADAYYEEIHASEDYEYKYDEMFAYDKLEKRAADYFSANYSSLNDWIEDTARTDKTLSDIITITIKETNSTTGKETTKIQYGVLFFQSHNGETWYENAKSGKINQKVEQWYDDQIAKNPIFYSDEVNNLDTKKPFLALMGY